ncbi:Predicted transcriptional regulator YheO, contains PAS and DNA-binding HTH domains [Lentibacillus persicus]|uniref:Predicted transcriptional regulator YheO, contains PAS and DNA-binding HTH domains n=1 Tax=Lentibacillus persicus TaxID=640948 RepID=A0A1I1W2M4_9BACI|nr:PAS domain-containing protein [Lentibacillus persicus]SFD87210.1 Predicted transcriptional regulator YheO, contains PAS and DNA-binding HTH domains [Lentibacillus persicus]
MDRQDEIIFSQAIRTADILVEMLGPKCEVAIHDFSNLERSLIYLAGTLTNRRIGSPITDLVLKELQREQDGAQDFANYKTVSKEGLVMKSSTVFLRNDSNKVIGALCMNIDISLMIQIGGEIQDFITFDSGIEDNKESFHTTVHEVIGDMTTEALRKFHKAATLLERDEKIDVIRELEKKGAFLIKGSTEYVASVMGVSKYTIYNYLQKVRTEVNLNKT